MKENSKREKKKEHGKNKTPRGRSRNIFSYHGSNGGENTGMFGGTHPIAFECFGRMGILGTKAVLTLALVEDVRRELSTLRRLEWHTHLTSQGASGRKKKRKKVVTTLRGHNWCHILPRTWS